jgi:hypothetical protein
MVKETNLELCVWKKVALTDIIAKEEGRLVTLGDDCKCFDCSGVDLACPQYQYVNKEKKKEINYNVHSISEPYQ